MSAASLPSSWAAEALAASTLLMVVALVMRLPMQRLFGARVAYALWALPALRLVMPRMPDWNADRLHVWLDAPGPSATTVQALPMADVVARPVAEVGSSGWVDAVPVLLPGLWLGGAAVFLLVQVVRHRRFVARILHGAELRRRDLGVAILAGPAVPGPLATGLFARAILLPADFSTRYAPRERRLVLAHEMAHHARGDLFANAAALVILALHWFNPVAHLAYRLFRADQEMACDETVLATAAPDAPGWYGRAVVKSAAPRFPAAACAMHGVGLVKRRLRLMGRRVVGPVRSALGAALGTALLCGGLAATASGGRAAPPPPPAPIPAAAAAPWFPPAEPAATVPRRTRPSAGRDAARLAAEAGRRAEDAGRRAAEAGARAAEAGARAAEAARAAARAVPAVPPAAPAHATRAAPAPARTPSLPGFDAAGLEREITRSVERSLAAAGIGRDGMMAEVDQQAIARSAAVHSREAAERGLRSARAAILATAMPEDARAQALAGIDRAIAGMARRH